MLGTKSISETTLRCDWTQQWNNMTAQPRMRTLLGMAKTLVLLRRSLRPVHVAVISMAAMDVLERFGITLVCT